MTLNALHLAEASLGISRCRLGGWWGTGGVGVGGGQGRQHPASQGRGIDPGRRMKSRLTAPGWSASAQRPRHSTEETRGGRKRQVGVGDADHTAHLSKSAADMSSSCPAPNPLCYNH